MTPDRSETLTGAAPGIGHLLRHALPNAITVMALGFGLTALVFAVDGNVSAAVACVLVSGLLDACDGRVARATGSASRFGAELDSLSDAICFGAVPAFMLYLWGLRDFGMAGWLVCLTVAAACALRLARFNVTVDRPGKPSWTAHYFTGVPAPAGAFLALLPIYAESGGILDRSSAGLLAMVSVPVTAVLMVSTWPSFSAKTVSRKALRLLFVPSLLALLAMAVGLFLDPWRTLTLAAAVYLLLLPVSRWRYGRHLRRAGLA